ncbi:MAG: hypothetical protein J5922_05050 [Clostridia bacterium]|nr:hypothetical protein [Clostridia bacterium]
MNFDFYLPVIVIAIIFILLHTNNSCSSCGGGCGCQQTTQSTCPCGR